MNQIISYNSFGLPFKGNDNVVFENYWREERGRSGFD